MLARNGDTLRWLGRSRAARSRQVLETSRTQQVHHDSHAVLEVVCVLGRVASSLRQCRGEKSAYSRAWKNAMPTDVVYAIHKRFVLQRRKTADLSLVLVCLILTLVNLMLLYASPTLAEAIAWSGQF